MPDMSNYQGYCNIKANKDLSAFNRRPPIRLGVIGYTNVICEPSDSCLVIPPIPLAPGSAIALTPPVIAQGSLLPSHSGPAGGAYPDRRLLDKDSNKPTSSTDNQLALPTIA
jgi:hypothetical protein